MADKELCDCGEVAVWCYMPGFSLGGNPHFCEGCVPRGCECNHNYVKVDMYMPPLDKPNLPTEADGVEGVNWKWIKEGESWCSIYSVSGLEWPCCEYMYEEGGWDIDEEE